MSSGCQKRLLVCRLSEDSLLQCKQAQRRIDVSGCKSGALTLESEWGKVVGLKLLILPRAVHAVDGRLVETLHDLTTREA